MFQLQLVLAKSYLAIKCYLAINRLFIDEKLSGHKSNLAIKKLTRPDQTRPDFNLADLILELAFLFMINQYLGQSWITLLILDLKL